MKPDRRIARTQELLRRSLLCLIQEKGFESISVQEIIDRANVGRATFYAHFDNKEHLLLSGFEELRSQLKSCQSKPGNMRGDMQDRVLAFSHALFEHVDEYRKIFRAMVGKESGAMVQRTLQKLLLDLIREEVELSPSRKETAIPSEALAQFIAGGLFGLLLWWLNARSPIPVENMNRLFRQLALPVLKPAV